MNIDLEKFITDLDEHFKKIPLTDEHAERLCSYIGSVKVTVELHRSNSGNTVTTKQMPLSCLANIDELKEEMKRIIQGNRADMIYEYQAFVEGFLNEDKEKEEDEE